MTVPRLSAAGRFNPACLFHPASIAVISTEGAAIAARLAMGGFKGAIQTVPSVADLTATPDLAIIATPPGAVIPTLEALAAKGCFAAIVPGPADGLPAAARRTGVRVLGPNAFGLAVPSFGLDLTKAHIPIPAGRLALISQSAGLTRAVIDWAGPNGVGFSHVIGLGDNADVGFGMALDWVSQDPATGAILMEIGHIKDHRAFLSAARAASRVRPVLAFRTGPRSPDPDGSAARVFEAALRRAGVLSLARPVPPGCRRTNAALDRRRTWWIAATPSKSCARGQGRQPQLRVPRRQQDACEPRRSRETRPRSIL